MHRVGDISTSERQTKDLTFEDINGNTKSKFVHHSAYLAGVDGETPQDLNKQYFHIQ